MVAISADMTATQDWIPLDGPHLVREGYYQLESEVLRLVSRRRAGGWFCDRAVAGSTAASHSSGATLTRYYPDAPAEGGIPQGGPLTEDLDAGGFALVVKDGEGVVRAKLVASVDDQELGTGLSIFVYDTDGETLKAAIVATTESAFIEHFDAQEDPDGGIDGSSGNSTLWGRAVINGASVAAGEADPSSGDGLDATIGSIYLRTGMSGGAVFVKTGGNDTDWSQLATVS